MKNNKVTLNNVCISESSNLAQKDIIELFGDYPVYGASGYINSVGFYKQQQDYVAVIKDGAGVGRTMYLPAKSSVIGTLQYLLPKENIESKYLYYAVTSMKLGSYYTGATIPHIYFKDYKHKTLPLPNKEVQKKIISILEIIEGIIQKRKNQLEEYDDLIKSRFIEMFGNKNKKIPVKSLCDISGGYSFKSGDITSDGDVKILQIGNVYLNDVNWETTNYLPKGYDVTYSKYSLNEGDIVVALTRPIIQSFGNVKACIIKASDMPCLLNQRVGRIVPKSNTEVSLKFIYGCLLTDDFTRYVEACLIGCSQPNISTKDIENYLIPDVGFEEQLEFGNFKDQVDKLKLSIQQSLYETQKLFNSLMQEYFG